MSIYPSKLKLSDKTLLLIFSCNYLMSTTRYNQNDVMCSRRVSKLQVRLFSEGSKLLYQILTAAQNSGPARPSCCNQCEVRWVIVRILHWCVDSVLVTRWNELYCLRSHVCTIASPPIKTHGLQWTSKYVYFVLTISKTLWCLKLGAVWMLFFNLSPRISQKYVHTASVGISIYFAPV